MHHHAAIVAGLVCSKFNHSTNKLEPGSLTLEDFRNGSIKSFKEPGTTVSDHLNQIMSKKFDAQMFENPFHLSAYILKQNIMSQTVLLCMISNDCMAPYWGPRGACVMSYQANAILKT
jgi:hypothetical protein